MKSNEQSPVDEYFRQHEAEIPVTFDNQHWSQLAAMLDAAETPGAPGGTVNRPAPRKTFRGGKGWWAPGIWILAVITTFWMIWQTAGSSAAENGDSRYPTVESPADIQSVAPKAEKELPKPVTGKVAEPVNGAMPERDVALPAISAPGAQKQESELTGSGEFTRPAVADSIVTRNLPVVPGDSAVQETKPVKKTKKHLFW
jgi:hypothetical protein